MASLYSFFASCTTTSSLQQVSFVGHVILHTLIAQEGHPFFWMYASRMWSCRKFWVRSNHGLLLVLIGQRCNTHRLLIMNNEARQRLTRPSNHINIRSTIRIIYRIPDILRMSSPLQRPISSYARKRPQHNQFPCSNFRDPFLIISECCFWITRTIYS